MGAGGPEPGGTVVKNVEDGQKNSDTSKVIRQGQSRLGNNGHEIPGSYHCSHSLLVGAAPPQF